MRMTSTTAALVGSPRRGHTHAHLWSLPDGTGLHAPYGQLMIESGTGRVCCHLCGRWYVSLGGHLHTHGHTAESYRETMGLCRSRPLVAAALSRSIATRQSEAYRRSPALRARLAVGQELSKTGQLATLACAAHTTSPPPELARLRRAALDTGRMTRAAQRDRVLADACASWASTTWPATYATPASPGRACAVSPRRLGWGGQGCGASSTRPASRYGRRTAAAINPAGISRVALE
jgi:hypothetical protein